MSGKLGQAQIPSILSIIENEAHAFMKQHGANLINQSKSGRASAFAHVYGDSIASKLREIARVNASYATAIVLPASAGGMAFRRSDVRFDHSQDPNPVSEIMRLPATVARALTSRTKVRENLLLPTSAPGGQKGIIESRETAVRDALRSGGSLSGSARRARYLKHLWENAIDAAHRTQLQDTLPKPRSAPGAEKSITDRSETAVNGALRAGGSLSGSARRALYLTTLLENAVDAAQEQRLREVLLGSLVNSTEIALESVPIEAAKNTLPLGETNSRESSKFALHGREAGSAGEQLQLARHFEKTYHHAEHDQIAMDYYLRSIQNGSIDALYQLGKFSDYKSQGIRSPLRPVEYYRKAASLQHADAQFIMGMLHLGLFDGSYLMPSPSPNYYERALNNDYHNDLFCMRQTKYGEVELDVQLGKEYLRQAAEQGHVTAKRVLLNFTPYDGTVKTFLGKLLAAIQS